MEVKLYTIQYDEYNKIKDPNKCLSPSRLMYPFSTGKHHFALRLQYRGQNHIRMKTWVMWTCLGRCSHNKFWKCCREYKEELWNAYNVCLMLLAQSTSFFSEIICDCPEFSRRRGRCWQGHQINLRAQQCNLDFESEKEGEKVGSLRRLDFCIKRNFCCSSACSQILPKKYMPIFASFFTEVAEILKIAIHMNRRSYHPHRDWFLFNSLYMKYIVE